MKFKFDMIKQILNLKRSDYLKYHHLIAAIPKYLKERISMYFLYRNKEDILIKRLKITKSTNQLLYKLQINTTTIRKTSCLYQMGIYFL